MKRVTVVTLYIIILCIPLSAQTPFKIYEDSIRNYFRGIAASNIDSEKIALNKKIIQLLDTVLAGDSSFFYPFDSLHYLGKLTSGDGLLRIYNWNIFYENKTYEYFGFIQYYCKKDDKFLLFPLTDMSEKIENPETAELTGSNWFGALYYSVVPVKISKKTFYTLLGWDGNNLFTSKKIIDVLRFEDDEPVFGANIFKFETKAKKYRVIYEFSAKASIMMKLDQNTGMIVYDHLSPMKPMYKGQYQFYGPDGSYDGFEFIKGKWNHVSDIDARNPKRK